MLQPSRSLPPNGYGLYAMCGSVCEWTTGHDDARPSEPLPGRGRRVETPTARVLRGGSCTDPAEVVTVSFRMALRGRFGATAEVDHLASNIGFRRCRMERQMAAVP